MSRGTAASSAGSNDGDDVRPGGAAPAHGDARKPDKEPSRGVTVRFADTQADLDAMLPLSLEAHAATRFGEFELDNGKRIKVLRRALTNRDRYALLLAEKDGQLIGFLFCTVADYVVGRGLIATVVAFFVREQVRSSLRGGEAAIRLLKGFLRWAAIREAQDVQIHVTSGIDLNRTHRFMQKVGFTPIGCNYAFDFKRVEVRPRPSIQ